MLVASYEWTQRASKFGIVDVPLVAIAVQDSNGNWKRYTFKVDSGAVVTTMGFDHSEDLEFKLDPKTLTTLKGVREREDKYYIHKASMKIGEKIINDVTIAFADGEIVEPLLGRLDIFNKFGIFFLPRDRHTMFSINDSP